MDQILSELRLSSKTKRRNRLEYKEKTLSRTVIKNTCTKYKVQTKETNYIILMSFIRFGKLKSLHSFITKGRCVKSRRRLTVLACHATT